MYEHLSKPELYDLYNRMNEQRWNVLDQLAAIDVGRTAVANAIRSHEEVESESTSAL